MSEPIIFNHTHLGCRYQIVIGKGYKLPMTSEDVTWYHLGDENGIATYELVKIESNKMADSSYGSEAEADALYDNFIAEKRDSRNTLKAEAVREPSLEEDLDTLADQHRRLLSLMNEIQHTKQRIEEKNNVVGSRIGKLYEAIAMTNRGEYPVDKAQW